MDPAVLLFFEKRSALVKQTKFAPHADGGERESINLAVFMLHCLYIIANGLSCVKLRLIVQKAIKPYSKPSYSRTVNCESICRIVSSATATTIKSAVPEILRT